MQRMKKKGPACRRAQQAQSSLGTSAWSSAWSDEPCDLALKSSSRPKYCEASKITKIKCEKSKLWLLPGCFLIKASLKGILKNVAKEVEAVDLTFCDRVKHWDGGRWLCVGGRLEYWQNLRRRPAGSRLLRPRSGQPSS